ncbi:MAG: hypothetical protein J5I93_02685 [Pirellulaceae bacterium]|nr:hypothetical protein [Pirellulaceae bacterium]
MTRRIHGLRLPLVFPSGLAQGEGSDYNTLRIARDGQGRPVLRGTSLAGALRHAWWQLHSEAGLEGDELLAAVTRFFGQALGDDLMDGMVSQGGTSSNESKRQNAATDKSELLTFPDSPLRVADCVLDLGQAQVLTRTHHRRDRHTGVVAHGGLFTLEACPPGTKTTAVLWLRDVEPAADMAKQFLQTVVHWFTDGLTLGGKSARGLGQAKLDGATTYCVYDLSNVGDYGRWLDDDRRWRQAGHFPAGVPLEPLAVTADHPLEVDLVLGIPRGQDLLVGDGQGLQHEMEPQRVQAADGRWYWRIPGASLRGVLRGWVHRLAARDEAAGLLPAGQRVSDPVAEAGQELDPADNRQENCPVACLFGSTLRAGRLKISDALVACRDAESGEGGDDQQLRRHVAVDRITGGAAESMLFDNTVLTADGNGRSPRFCFTLRIGHPEVRETQWLAAALRALDLGLLRVGSSKSSGRLSLVEAPVVRGGSPDTARPFVNLRPMYTSAMFGE